LTPYTQGEATKEKANRLVSQADSFVSPSSERQTEAKKTEPWIEVAKVFLGNGTLGAQTTIEIEDTAT